MCVCVRMCMCGWVCVCPSMGLMKGSTMYIISALNYYIYLHTDRHTHE